MRLRVLPGGRKKEKELSKKQSPTYKDPRDMTGIMSATWDMWRELDQWLSLKATNTQKNYRKTFESFLCLFAVQRDEKGADRIAAIGPSEVTRYLCYLQTLPAQPGRSAAIGERISGGTVKHKITILSSIWEQLIIQEAVAKNPWKRALRDMRGVEGNDRRPHRAIPDEKIHELLFQLRYKKNAEGARDRAMLAASVGGALRPSEALALRLADIKAHDKGGVALLLRHTKRQRAELQIIPSWAAEIVTRYAEIRRMEGAKEKDPLFTSYLGGKATNAAIPDRTWRNIFKRYMERVDLDSDYSPHDLRATAITRLRKLGHSYEQIRHFSRHSSITMVMRYDKIAGDSEAADLAEKLSF